MWRPAGFILCSTVILTACTTVEDLPVERHVYLSAVHTGDEIKNQPAKGYWEAREGRRTDIISVLKLYDGPATGRSVELLQTGQPAEAAEYIRRRLLTNKEQINSGHAYNNLGCALLASGKLEKAVATFNHAGILLENSDEVRHNLRVAYALKNVKLPPFKTYEKTAE